MANKQLDLIPNTRYQGSKRKIVDWILNRIEGIEFDTVLDLFGGTGSVSYGFKSMGKKVVYNDVLPSNYHIGRALIENNRTNIGAQKINDLFSNKDENKYDNLVSRVFDGIYFTDEENSLIDTVAQNIPMMEDEIKQSMAYFCLFQSLIMKRPYNLFHRANLYMRTAEVKRSFGNKATWEKPLKVAFEEVAENLNKGIFDNGRANRALNLDCHEVVCHPDLVYLDTPYINARGTGVDYRDFYHFLDGICDYQGWEEKIDFKSKHKRLIPIKSPWSDPKQILGQFHSIFDRYSDSTIVVSYRSSGIPEISELKRQLERHKKYVSVSYKDGYQYALSPNKENAEVLLIGTNTPHL